MSRRVFITGATGFAGRHLTDACRAAGDDVVTAPPAAEADLRNPAVARALVARARPDVVFHLAARAHVGQSWEDPLGTFADNVALSAGVLEAVRHEAPEAVVVHVGSSEEYGPPPGPEPMTEDMLPRPQNPYAVSKASSTLVATFYADAYGLRVLRARAFNHVGPGQERDLRARQLRVPGRGRPRRGPGPDPDRHGQRRHAPRLHRRPRRRPRLPPAGRARGAGPVQRLLRRLALRPRADRRPRRRGRRRDRPRGRRRSRPRQRGPRGPRLRRPPARRDRLAPRDPVRADPAGHPALVALPLGQAIQRRAELLREHAGAVDLASGEGLGSSR